MQLSSSPFSPPSLSHWRIKDADIIASYKPQINSVELVGSLMAQVHLGNGLKKQWGKKKQREKRGGEKYSSGLIEKSSRQNRPLRTEPSGSGPISDPMVLQ